MDDALGEGLEDGIEGLVIDGSGLGVEIMHIISHLNSSLGTRLNSIMRQMTKQHPTILSQSKPKHPLTLTFILIKLNLII